jgi:hypothetical protein
MHKLEHENLKQIVNAGGDKTTIKFAFVRYHVWPLLLLAIATANYGITLEIRNSVCNFYNFYTQCMPLATGWGGVCKGRGPARHRRQNRREGGG